jgi:hypothetical protein
MAVMSPPLAVADATPVNFSFRLWKSSVNVQLRFYTDADGTVEVGTRGTGQRDVTATNTTSAYEGPFSDPALVVPSLVSDINGGTITNMVDGKWYEIELGSGMGQLTLAAVSDVDPVGSVTYRVIAEAEGSCTV